MSNKKIEPKTSDEEAKTDKTYLDYRVTSHDTAQHYHAKEVKVEKIVINFK